MATKRIIIIDNTLDASQWEHYEVEDVCAFLKDYYKEWPATAHIYHNQVAVCNEVTPHDDATIEKLQSLEGTFYCVVYPAEPTSIVIGIIAVVAAVAAVLITSRLCSMTSTVLPAAARRRRICTSRSTSAT